MFSNKTLALIGAMALSVLGAQPAFANDRFQDYPQTQTPATPTTDQTRENNRSASRPTETVLPGRIGGDRNDRRQERERTQRGRPAAAPTPEQNKAAAQVVATAAGLTCQVTEANRLGLNAEQQVLYEVACDAGPGFILQASTPPQTYNCMELLGQAFRARQRDPAADVGQQCAIAHNIDVVSLVSGYAHEAGVACPVDQAAVIGKSTAGNLVYEAGCAGGDGHWLEKQPTGWLVTDCLEVVMTRGVCSFTTPEEQAASFQGKLAGTDASGCQVTQVRLMGSNSNGRFYEAKCAAGDGYIARVDPAGQTQQVYVCAAAQHIGDGCKLTPTPAAAPATTEQH